MSVCAVQMLLDLLINHDLYLLISPPGSDSLRSGLMF